MRQLLILLFLPTALGFGQNFDYTITVKTNQGKPDIGRDVVFVEATTYEHMAFKTDQNGQLHIVFDHGNFWLGSVGEMRNCIELETQGSGRGSRTLTYDPHAYKRENETRPDRRSIQFNVIDQRRLPPVEGPDFKNSLVTIVLVDRENNVYPKIEVSLVCFETATKYEGYTNARGAVSFKVPINQKYDIDVDGLESMKFIDLDNRPSSITLKVLFQPTLMTERKDDRFVVQNLSNKVEPSSTHARVQLQVRKDGTDAVKEDVYIRMLKSNKVYRAKTDDQGEVTFLLPIRNKYFVDFQYQKEAAEIDLSKVQGIAFKKMGVQYTIDPRLSMIENFIPSVKELVEYDVMNFVDAQYPEPVAEDVDFYLKWGNKFNENSKEALLEVGIKTKSKLTRKSAIPLNICFVIDKSGSMMGEDRLEQVKKSLIRFVSQLDSTDRVSIVVFENQATVAVPNSLVGNKKKIIDIIYAIKSDGGTNILNGMVMGFEEVKKFQSPKYINRLLLLTDGYGSEPPLTVVTEAKRHIKTGVELSAIGVGTDYNQALLGQLASAGGGLLHLAGTSQNIEDVFQRELESILYPMAKQAKLTIRYNNQIIYRQLFGYANETVSSGKMSVDIPHLFPGLDQMALVKFDLINPTKSIENEPVTVQLEFMDAITNKPVVLTKKIHPEWTLANGKLDLSIDKEHKKVQAVAIANQSLKKMAESNESGNREEALIAVQNGLMQMKTLFPNATPEQLISVMDRLQEYVNAFREMKSLSTY